MRGVAWCDAGGMQVLHFWDPVTYKQLRSVVVRDAKGNPVEKLNELEYVAFDFFRVFSWLNSFVDFFVGSHVEFYSIY
jgi:glutamine cyclotransferase